MILHLATSAEVEGLGVPVVGPGGFRTDLMTIALRGARGPFNPAMSRRISGRATGANLKRPPSRYVVEETVTHFRRAVAEEELIVDSSTGIREVAFSATYSIEIT